MQPDLKINEGRKACNTIFTTWVTSPKAQYLKLKVLYFKGH